MNPDLVRAMARLEAGDYTVVLCRDGVEYTDTRRGVEPLLALLDSGVAVTGFSAADRVVGKAAAFLYLRLGVTAVHGGVMSQPAHDLLTAHGVCVSADTVVPAIRNRAGDGFCPMEAAVWELTDPIKAEAAVRTTLRSLTTPKM